jgi:hypothetical protein
MKNLFSPHRFDSSMATFSCVIIKARSHKASSVQVLDSFPFDLLG